MLAEEKLYNVLASLWNFIEGRYSLTAKFFWGYNGLDTRSITEWVEFSYATARRTEHRLSDQDRPGATVHLDLTCDIYVKRGQAMLRTLVIRDTLVELLRRPVVTIRDWSGTKAAISQLVGQGVILDRPIAADDELNRHTVMFDFQYMEQFARATNANG